MMRKDWQPVTLYRFEGVPEIQIEASINPVDGSVEINRIQEGETTDGVRLPLAAALLLEPMLSRYIAAKMKETRRTRSELRSWAKRLHT